MIDGATCFICGETYYNDTETHITVRRLSRDPKGVRKIIWDGMVCDSCLRETFGLKGVGDDR